MDKATRELREDYHSSCYSRHNVCSEGTYQFYERFYERLLKCHLPPDRNASLVDIGCGVGYLARALMAMGYTNVRGVDLDPDQLRVCSHMAGVEVVEADAIAFLEGCADQSIAGTMMFDILEHIPKAELLHLCREVWRVLQPGGALTVRVPNMSNLFAASCRYVDITHEVGFTESSLSQLLHLAGFEDVQHHSSSPRMKRLSWLREAVNEALHRMLRRIVIGPVPGPKLFGHDLLTVARKAGSTASSS